MKKKILILCFLALLIIIFILKEKFNNYHMPKFATFHASKCFSCENQLPPQKLYQSQKTKCFSCEQDLIKRKKSPSLGQPVKCFSCL